MCIVSVALMTQTSKRMGGDYTKAKGNFRLYVANTARDKLAN
jgi:hypothetical protein